ncbi:Platelet-activating factor acetylhydrolase 2, cytoplasmic [Nymphon striatum]|nr:Platelet-activating factor acetylhydrolase 2, cytoplasmic [Nymphon striatum]
MEGIKQLKHCGYRHTPLPTGSYVVACTDIMTPAKHESQFGSFVRLFYPADGDAIINYSSQWPQWIPDSMYLEGFADFLKMRSSVFRPTYKLLVGSVYIPAIWNGPVHRKLTNCPVVVFSHGLGGSRTAYSTICTELASYGFVVAAVEHRDKSAAISYNLLDADQSVRRDQEPLKSVEEVSNDNKCNEPCKSVDVRDTQDSTKIFPRSLKHDWIRFQQLSKDDNAYQIRNNQVHQRAEECALALDLLESLNKGEFVDNLLDNGQSLQTTFTNLMDLSRASIIGHSFGGATVLKTLSREKNRFSVGICLDSYMFPVEEEVEMLKSLTQPLLFINTEKFSSQKNSMTMKILEASEAERIFLTIK